jgi:molecular chaperone GrpE
MEKEKDLQQEEMQDSSNGKAGEKAQQDGLTPETLPAMEASEVEADATSPQAGAGAASQQHGEDTKPRNGEAEAPAATAEAQPYGSSSSIEEMQDRFLRLAADFANYKRRNEQERAAFADHVRRDFALALLPVLDDFGLMMEYDSEHPERLVEGARLIHQKLMEILSKQGLEKIEELNQPFDYERHEAVLAQPVEDKALDHVVLSVMQDGYLFKGKVLRPSKVIVGQYSEEQPNPSASEGDNQAEAGGGEPNGEKSV